MASQTIIEAEIVAVPRVRRSFPFCKARRRLWAWTVAGEAYLASAVDWLFGLLALVLGLAILAAIPLAQFLSLGYLLEASGRIGRTGRISAGLVGIRAASRVGSIVIGIWLLLLPLRWASNLWQSAVLIDPNSKAAHHWGIGVFVLGTLLAIHGISACWRGGRLRHFLLPVVNPRRVLRRLRRGRLYAEARDAVWEFVMGLRLPYYFWLGLRGFIGGLLWLAVPVMLLADGQKSAAVGWVGAVLLMVVIVHLPLLQAHFAAENRLRAMFEVRRVRRLFTQAPLAYWLAVSVTLLSALPLYLLKIEIIPREAAWLPSLIFVVFILPTRMASGWAYARSVRHEQPRIWLSRHLSRLGMLPIAALYVLILFFMQYTAWNGVVSLYEQHAFLMPVPFLDL